MQKFLWSIGVASLLFTANAAENLLKSGDGEDAELAAKWGQGTRQNTNDKNSGSACMENSFTSRNFVYSPELIEIDPSKTYKLSGFFKSAEKDKKNKAMFCIRYYNSGKKEIGPFSVLPVVDTGTVLAADAKKGDKSLRIKPREWNRNKGQFYAVAFNVKDDLSDLPNLDVISISDISPKDTFNEVTLGSPLIQDYLAGTKVRMHRYLDYTALVNDVPGEWTEYSITISGESNAGTPALNKFWNGTKFIKICIFAFNVSPLLFDDITFQEVTQK